MMHCVSHSTHFPNDALQKSKLMQSLKYSKWIRALGLLTFWNNYKNFCTLSHMRISKKYSHLIKFTLKIHCNIHWLSSFNQRSESRLNAVAAWKEIRLISASLAFSISHAFIWLKLERPYLIEIIVFASSIGHFFLFNYSLILSSFSISYIFHFVGFIFLIYFKIYTPPSIIT